MEVGRVESYKTRLHVSPASYLERLPRVGVGPGEGRSNGDVFLCCSSMQTTLPDLPVARSETAESRSAGATARVGLGLLALAPAAATNNR
jgi:hypothetical protein